MNCWWLKIRSPEARLNPANTRYNCSHWGCLMHTVMCSHVVWDLQLCKYSENFDKCVPSWSQQWYLLWLFHMADLCDDCRAAFFKSHVSIKTCVIDGTYSGGSCLGSYKLSSSCSLTVVPVRKKSQYGEQRPLLLQQLMSEQHPWVIRVFL